MKTLFKILGITAAVVAVAFTVCAVLDYFYNTGRGSYFEIEGDEN